MYNGRADYFRSGRASADAEAAHARIQNLRLMKEKEEYEKALKELGPRLICKICGKEIIVIKKGGGIDTFCCAHWMEIIE